MSDQRDSFRIVRLNERARMVAGILANLASVLLAAIAYRIFVELRPDGTALLWMVGAGLIIWSAHGLLGLVEPEN